MVSAIVCVDKNWGIGYQGDLLCKIPEDIEFFKEQTTNNIVIMGRKTWESIGEKPLPNRLNIVVTSKYIDTFPYVPIFIDKETNVIFMSLKYFKRIFYYTRYITDKDIFIIGGGQIYKELLPYCDKVYVTEVEYEFENVDTYFQNLNELHDWHITEINPSHEYNGVKYRFCVYEKEKN